MEFKFQSSVFIEEKDLEEMTERIKNGEGFESVYRDFCLDIMDDDDYPVRNIIKNDVKTEIEKRLDCIVF